MTASSFSRDDRLDAELDCDFEFEHADLRRFYYDCGNKKSES